MELEQSKNKLNDLIIELIKEDILDLQFKQLEKLEVDSPGFVSSMMSLFLEGAESTISQMHLAMKHAEELQEVDDQAMKLKGSSLSIGAKRIAIACEAIRKCCKENDHAECSRSFQQLKREHSLLKTKVEPLLKLEKETEDLDGSTKMLSES